MVTVSQTAGHNDDTIGALIERVKQILCIRLPGTGEPDDFHVRRVFFPKRSRGIRSHITAVDASKEGDFRIKILLTRHHDTLGRRAIASCGHAVMQVPQPVQDHGSTMGARSPGISKSAL
jgi:hypothetical protein